LALQYYFQIHKTYTFRQGNTVKRIKLSFKTYLKYSVLKAAGELMFYLGPALVGVGIALYLASPFFLSFSIAGIVAGIALSVSGYLIHKYGKFRENAEQIARGVSQDIQDVSGVSHTIPPPSSNICPTCHHPLTFIDQYKAWYCFNCKEYK
jgi:hypothetical protein